MGQTLALSKVQRLRTCSPGHHAVSNLRNDDTRVAHRGDFGVNSPEELQRGQKKNTHRSCRQMALELKI